MADVEVFMDAVPGETRGVVARNGRFEHLILHRDSDAAVHRLGARSVGRVVTVDAGLRGAFVDLGVEPFGFLPTGKSDRLSVGSKLQVAVSAEPRADKGPTLSLVGAGEGEARLLEPGPTVAETLARLAPDRPVITGREAMAASEAAWDEAAEMSHTFPEPGLNLSLERTRALVAVDIDYAGSERGGGRARANREGLAQAARLIRLKGWGGLAAVDLVGTALDGGAVMTAAKAAFASDPDVVMGPVNRFGVLMLSLPWRRMPLEERGRGREARAIEIVRGLALALADDTATPRCIARCGPEDAAVAAPLVARLGPRAGILVDAAMPPGRWRIETP